MNLLPQILVSLLLFTGVFLFVWTLFRYPVPPEPPVHRRVAAALGTDQRRVMFDSPLFAGPANLALNMARGMAVPSLRAKIRRDLEASGNPKGYSIDEYLALSLLGGAALGVAATILGATMFGQFDLLLLMAAGGVGFAIPMWDLHSAANARILRISRKIPYTLDLIALMMAAGSSFTEAIDTIIKDDPDDDFNQELAFVRNEIELGTTRSVALANLAQRVPIETLRSIIGAVNQAEALGTPLSHILKTQSAMLRLHRTVRAEKLSASASLRILFPSTLILLAVVLIMFGPIILRWMESKLLRM